MLGEAIGCQALGHAGLRQLASEQSGPRPAAVREDFSEGAERGEHRIRIEMDGRTARASRP